MSNEENGNEDLKSFERALAALRPRADGLDSAWRSLLAKEVSLTGELQDRAARPRGKRPAAITRQVIGLFAFIAAARRHAPAVSPAGPGRGQWRP